jgi:hypothetical protein
MMFVQMNVDRALVCHNDCFRLTGRSPGFWLQTRFIQPSQYALLVTYSCFCRWMNNLPVTVARLRRICTDFPILPDGVYQATRTILKFFNSVRIVYGSGLQSVNSWKIEAGKHWMRRPYAVHRPISPGKMCSQDAIKVSALSNVITSFCVRGGDDV